MLASPPIWSNRIRPALIAAGGSDAAPGLVLIAMAIAAMVAANSRLAGLYQAVFHTALHATMAWPPDLQAWINEGLMVVFFFTVGLELKREALIGELALPARRRLPLLAAAAGMIAPALVYLAGISGHRGLAAGWAIPTSTDIAFAMGVLALVGPGLPASLRLFLLSVAVVDDLGAVTIIALFYPVHPSAIWLASSGGVLAGLVALNRSGCRRGTAYVALSLLLWVCVLHSGVHPSIAGVAAAVTVPLRAHPGEKARSGLLLHWERTLQPWCAWLILPLFALANAGVSLTTRSGGWLDSLLQPLPMAVAAGLAIGKPLGIFSAVALARWLGVAQPPRGATLAQLCGISALAGIGFTMSLFFAPLAFPDAPQLAEAAKLGVLAGSLLSAVAGFAILRLASARR